MNTKGHKGYKGRKGHKGNVILRPVQPMMAVSAAMLPSGPDWTYEVKWDG